MIARFWWGAKNGDRKIHWKRWDTMNNTTQQKGFGFKELQDFNVAMLAKMVGRVLKEPNALLVRVLKTIYLPSTDFLYASKRC